MYSDMAEYLVDRGERSLQKRLMGDYKDGKAFSYFDAEFVVKYFFIQLKNNLLCVSLSLKVPGPRERMMKITKCGLSKRRAVGASYLHTAPVFLGNFAIRSEKQLTNLEVPYHNCLYSQDKITNA